MGRGFTVVADEVRKLSTLSGETGKKIAETVEAVNKAIKATLQASLEYVQQDAEMVTSSEQAIERVLSQFKVKTSVLSDSADVLRRESELIRSDINEVLVALQFQDRVSQMLSHVRNDLEKLEQHLNESNRMRTSGQALAPMDSATWLDALSLTYTMPEQHAIHSGSHIQGSASQPEITLF